MYRNPDEEEEAGNAPAEAAAQSGGDEGHDANGSPVAEANEGDE